MTVEIWDEALRESWANAIIGNRLRGEWLHHRALGGALKRMEAFERNLALLVERMIGG